MRGRHQRPWRPRRRRSPMRLEPRGLATVGMLGMVLLASGFGSVDGAPADAWMEDSLAPRAAAPELLEPITDGSVVPPDVQVPAGLAPPRTRQRAPREPFERDYRAIALQIAQEEGLRMPELFVRQIAAESGMQPCVYSPVGAIGIAQIMPDTADGWGVDPYLPERALRAAARAMKRYHAQYGDIRLALAAYNAGPGAVARFGGVPPYRETQDYIRKIMDRSYPLAGMNQTFILPAGYSTKFGPALRQLIAAVEAEGGEIRVVSGHRTWAEQYRIWQDAKRRHGGWRNARRWAAPPGCSNHNRGWAADLAGDLHIAQRLAPQFGLVFPMAHEPWHVELAGIPTQSG